ncbi:MAG: hypothetical protein ABW056_03595, partial [Thermoanaerobaculia bacterium]
GSTVVELLKAHVFSPPRPFSESDPEGRLPAELRGAVLKSLQKKREDRFENAEEFDREILAIRSRHLRPENVEQMRVELARIRPSGVIRVEPATPSAQGEIDRQFAALKTPTPSRRTGEDDRTTVAPEPVPMPRPLAPPSLPHELVPTTPIPRVPGRRVPPWLIGAVLAVIAVGGVLWATARRRPEPQPSAAVAAEPTPAASEPAATAAFLAAPEATALPQLEPTPEPAEPTPQPPPTAAPRAPTRVAVLAPRNVAQPSPRPAVGAPVLIPTAPAPAATPFVSAAGAPPPAEAPRATVPAPAPPPSARPAPTEADRIRETIRLYETAQNTLDTELYVRVFPSVDRSRVEQAFSSFRSQSVGFEIRKIEMSPQGTSALVFGFETRVAVPKAGNDLHVTADRVLQLEKRGDAWVIVAVR